MTKENLVLRRISATSVTLGAGVEMAAALNSSSSKAEGSAVEDRVEEGEMGGEEQEEEGIEEGEVGEVEQEGKGEEGGEGGEGKKTS